MRIHRAIALGLVLAALGAAFGSEVYFSPRDGVRDQIIKRINRSKTSIDVAMYSFTAGDIAQALADARKRGVAIRMIRDKSQSANKNDENSFLSGAGIPVEIRSGKGNRGIMHNKFAVFDGREVLTGSYNWTNNAEHNNWENSLFTDEAGVVAAYQKEFEVLWKAPAARVKSRTSP